MDTYRTICKKAQSEFTEKRSRFIGHVKPVENEKDALDFITEIKTEHPAASHNVYAYVLRENNIHRFSDQGEPQGTAGIPALEVLLKGGITDCAVVVTRYFGGVLLGTGGLVRAYSHAVKVALEAAGIVTMGRCFQVALICGYHQYEKLYKMIENFSKKDINAEFYADVRITFQIPQTKLEIFKKQISEYTLGSVIPEILGECYAPI